MAILLILIAGYENFHCRVSYGSTLGIFIAAIHQNPNSLFSVPVSHS